MEKRLVVIAHNIRSAYNVGAIFRTADGMGAEKIYLTGYSARPFCAKEILPKQDQRMIAKTALGAEKSVPWEGARMASKVVDKLRAKGFEILALEQHPRSVNYLDYKPGSPVAIIVGNEPRGIHPKIIKKCDAIVEIPMRGKKNSLNVAVALGIAGYAIMAKD
jgi:tRNA G18 (ribose-2'-O)-methylase SpoU